MSFMVVNIYDYRWHCKRQDGFFSDFFDPCARPRAHRRATGQAPWTLYIKGPGGLAPWRVWAEPGLDALVSVEQREHPAVGQFGCGAVVAPAGWEGPAMRGCKAFGAARSAPIGQGLFDRHLVGFGAGFVVFGEGEVERAADPRDCAMWGVRAVPDQAPAMQAG